MQIRLAESFQVFDVARLRQNTLVSVRVDGRTYFGLTLAGIRKLSSGEKVAVAFEGRDEERLLAWLDPETGEANFVGLWGPLFGLVPAILAAIFARKLLDPYVPSFIATVCACIAFTGVSALVVREVLRRNRIKSMLVSLQGRGTQVAASEL